MTRYPYRYVLPPRLVDRWPWLVPALLILATMLDPMGGIR